MGATAPEVLWISNVLARWSPKFVQTHPRRPHTILVHHAQIAYSRKSMADAPMTVVETERFLKDVKLCYPMPSAPNW
jgi:tmRNA-binding protein